MVVVVAVGHGRVLVLLVLEVWAAGETVPIPQQPLQEPPILVEVEVEVVSMVALLAVWVVLALLFCVTQTSIMCQYLQLAHQL
jgi:hypothetical protein